MSACTFSNWANLVDACQDYAQKSGWRFNRVEFMRLDGPQPNAALHEARLRAMPAVLEYGQRLQSAAEVGSSESELLQEFLCCQKLVSSEAVLNAIISICKALELPGFDGKATAGRGSGSGFDVAYHDMTAPLEVIARRLRNHLAMIDANEEARERRNARVLQASFITEFGLEHGLPEVRDPTAEAMLSDFLLRVTEWGRRDRASAERVKSLNLEGQVPPGRTHAATRAVLSRWVEQNQREVLIGGAVAVAGLAVGAALFAGLAKGRR